MKALRWIAVVALVVLLSITALNYFAVKAPVDQVIDADVRNHGVRVWVHYRHFVDISGLVFDLRSISSENSMADVFRTFLQAAKGLRGSEFRAVVLSFRGTPKFLLEGSYFKKLGEEYDSQNPVYTMRTFASNLYRVDGSKAYPEWTGGWLGVLQKEMEQFNEFHKEWYLSELSVL